MSRPESERQGEPLLPTFDQFDSMAWLEKTQPFMLSNIWRSRVEEPESPVFSESPDLNISTSMIYNPGYALARVSLHGTDKSQVWHLTARGWITEEFTHATPAVAEQFYDYYSVNNLNEQSIPQMLNAEEHATLTSDGFVSKNGPVSDDHKNRFVNRLIRGGWELECLARGLEPDFTSEDFAIFAEELTVNPENLEEGFTHECFHILKFFPDTNGPKWGVIHAEPVLAIAGDPATHTYGVALPETYQVEETGTGDAKYDFHVSQYFYRDGVMHRRIIERNGLYSGPQMAQELNQTLAGNSADSVPVPPVEEQFVHAYIRHIGAVINEVGGLIKSVRTRPYRERLLHKRVKSDGKASELSVVSGDLEEGLTYAVLTEDVTGEDNQPNDRIHGQMFVDLYSTVDTGDNHGPVHYRMMYEPAVGTLTIGTTRLGGDPGLVEVAVMKALHYMENSSGRELFRNLFPPDSPLNSRQLRFANVIKDEHALHTVCTSLV